CEGLGGEEGGEFDVVGADTQKRGILADAAALHLCRDHDRRESDRGPRIEGPEEESLRAAATGTSDADACGIHVRQGADEIEGANAVPRLQAQEALQTKLAL